MLDSDAYAEFAAACDGAGVRLLTDAVAYRSTHELPGWVDLLEPSQPRPPAAQEGSTIDALAARVGSGPAVVRDHVKSAKHYWDDAVLVPEVGTGSDCAGWWSASAR